MRGKYNIVDTEEKLRDLDKVLMDENGQPRYKLLAFDTETNGLDLYKSTVVGFSISFDKNSGYYIPLLQWIPDEASRKMRSVDKVKYSACMNGKLRCVWTGQFFDEFVTPQEYNIVERFPVIPALLQRWLGQTNLIMHNAPFDINMTYVSTGVDLKDQLFVDTGLLVHALDENSPTALKKVIERYANYLGIDFYKEKAVEQKELNKSIIENGGKPGMVWRASLGPQGKYAAADTFYTYGVYQAALAEFSEKFGEKGLEWFFQKEVMPVCKEVVIDMKRRGVYVDVPYFQKLYDENAIKMDELEDSIIKEITPLLSDFTLGKSIDQAVSKQRLVKRIIELEGLSVPTKVDKKTGQEKESLAKGVVKKEYENNPHWIWAYVLGEDEIKYSDEKLENIKKQLFVEVVGQRYQFNIGSRNHLIWLFCDKLGIDKKKLPQTDSATAENPSPKMDADILKEHMLPRFPWVSKLLTYKKLQKLQSTYIRPALVLNIDGWLYMDMKQNGTTSGRFSCSGGYNLQTLPRVDDEMEILNECDHCKAERFNKDGTETGLIEIIQELECIADRKCKNCGHVLNDITRPSAIKKGFVAPPGYKIINADYSSLEPRCFAFVSGEDKLKEVYWKGLDLYSKVYCDIFDVEKQYSADPSADNFLKKVAKPKRTWIKPVVLGIPYGAEEDQVANLIGAVVPKKIKGQVVLDDDGNPVMVADHKEGKRVRDLYLSTYSKLKEYMERQEDMAVTLGYVESLIGRRRHLPFAKKINDVLSEYDIDWRDLTYAPIWELRKGLTISYTSFRGARVTLTEEMMRAIQDKIKFKDESMQTKGYWAYVRSLLRSDLNNAKNNPIQALAGHITNKGMLDTNRKFRQAGLDAWVCLQVHDEITGYAKIDQAEQSAACLKEGMEKNEFTSMIDVDMIAEPAICDNLKESK